MTDTRVVRVAVAYSGVGRGTDTGTSKMTDCSRVDDAVGTGMVGTRIDGLDNAAVERTKTKDS